MRTKYDKIELKDAVKKSLSIAGVCRNLKIKAHGGNYKTLNDKIKKFNIDVSHFTGQGWNTGNRFREFGRKRELVDILIKESPHISGLRKRLIKDDVKTNKCEKCGVDEWMNKPITCELDHINGDSRDNRIENLIMLCPNCHSQTPTFRGRNKR